MYYKDLIKELLLSPKKLKTKKPFVRGMEFGYEPEYPENIDIGNKIQAQPPTVRYKIVTQERFMRELDPYCHDVLFDENIPSICVKLKDGGYQEVKQIKTAIPIQRLILDEQVIYLTRNKMLFTLVDTNPTNKQNEHFIICKQYWEERNQDGLRNKMVRTQLSYGEAGLLYYFDHKGRIKSRILSFEDGYVLCPHNDQNGDRILESVYYVKDDIEYIDSYDEQFMYRWTNNAVNTNDYDNGWVWHEPIEHGFKEIPLITKRGKVAWDSVQNEIESFEELYNVFITIQKKHGWGIFYVKGKFKDDGRRIAGNVVLNDTSIEGKGDAKFLTPPSPDGMMDTLKFILRTIQMGASTTFILPDDIKTSGDVSGIAVQLTKELDIQGAAQRVIDWQNVADKMWRLFKYGLSVELVNNKQIPTAITDFENLHVSAKFKEWRPFSEVEYNQMLVTLKGAGLLSQESGIELNTVSKPDERARIERENEANINMLAEQQKVAQENNLNN